jgi:hypothetical protein
MLGRLLCLGRSLQDIYQWDFTTIRDPGYLLMHGCHSSTPAENEGVRSRRNISQSGKGNLFPVVRICERAGTV